MARSRHNVTARGTQKQRVKTHEDFLRTNFPRIWQAKIDAELAPYRRSKGAPHA